MMKGLLTIILGGDPSATAANAMKAIIKAEQSFHSALDTSYTTMGDTTFKALRRALPITRMKIDWNKIRTYKIASELKVFIASPSSRFILSPVDFISDSQELFLTFSFSFSNALDPMNVYSPCIYQSLSTQANNDQKQNKKNKFYKKKRRKEIIYGINDYLLLY